MKKASSSSSLLSQIGSAAFFSLPCTILMQMTNASAHRVAVIRHAIDGLETVLRRNLPHSQLSPAPRLNAFNAKFCKEGMEEVRGL